VTINVDPFVLSVVATKSKDERQVKKTTKKRFRPDPAHLDPNTTPVMKSGMVQALGIRVTSLTPRKVVGEMTITPMHTNVNGRVNGGAIMAFADALGAVGAVANRPPGYRGGTIESKTNFFAAGVGPLLLAVSVPLHIGRTTSVWQTTITNVDGAMVAMVTQTQIAVPMKVEGD
jgi:1,4-dihydroxy-2-naphthoyl-CoA hydrolase